MCVPQPVPSAKQTLSLLTYSIMQHAGGPAKFEESPLKEVFDEYVWLYHSASVHDQLAMVDCAAAFLILSQPKHGDTSEITERRKIFAELAAFVGSPVFGNALSFAVVLHKYAILHRTCDDSRKRAFAEHADREALELDAAAI